ncbi:MAG TPA: rRNA maturation RNase YbeY [Myxococcota bacterium]|nr:rRNA maturation RNase YbeY [Myxococcota bacterium]
MIVRLAGPPRRRGLPPVDKRLLRRRARCILDAVGCDSAELSVCLVKDGTMEALNAAHRGKRLPTDVLSFSLIEGPHAQFRGGLLGDVVIGIETAARQARAQGRDLNEEVTRLLIHGVLHLLGHDHVRPAEARRMRAEERRVARALAP